MRYRAQWRSLVYETDDWYEINFYPWFLRESKILFGPDSVLDRTEPENPAFSLRQVIHPEIDQDGRATYSTNNLLADVANDGSVDDSRVREERLRAWRSSLKEARDFYRFYLAVYVALLLGWLYVDGKAPWD